MPSLGRSSPPLTEPSSARRRGRACGWIRPRPARTSFASTGCRQQTTMSRRSSSPSRFGRSPRFERIAARHAEAPQLRLGQKTLADDMVTLVHGAAAATAANEAADCCSARIRPVRPQRVRDPRRRDPAQPDARSANSMTPLGSWWPRSSHNPTATRVARWPNMRSMSMGCSSVKKTSSVTRNCSTGGTCCCGRARSLTTSSK